METEVNKMTKQPSYRFAGYTEPWEEKKLGKVVELKRGLTYKPTSVVKKGIRVLRSSNIDGDTFKKKEDDVFVDENSVTIPYVQFGDILITAANGSSKLVGKHAVIEDNEKMVHGGFMLLARSKQYNFLNALLSSEWYSRFINVSVSGGNGAIGNLSKGNLEKEIVLFPSLPEQTAIGSFFQDIDQLISLHQRKLEVLKEQKKTYLKFLFPAKGQTKPALRFAGYEDEWKEVKLGEYCDIYTGKLDANAMVPDGEYDFYTSGIQKYKIDVAAFEGPAITIAGNGATVGYMHYADGKFNAYQRTYVLSNFLADRSFIYSEIGRKLPSKIQQEARTGNIPYIVMDMLTKLDICLPSLPEQTVIGSFFQDLDKAIAKQEEKVNQLKESKQTLLRKMFI